MQWSDVTKPASHKTLRQFSALFLLVFGGMAAWRAWNGDRDTTAAVLAASALLVGTIGLLRPVAVRPFFTAWMMAAFPIGWTVSRIMLGLMFYRALHADRRCISRVGKGRAAAPPARCDIVLGRKNRDRRRQAIFPAVLRETTMAKFEDAAKHEARTGFVSEFWQFLKTSKKWWLLPIVVVLVLFGVLVLLSGTAAAPFIYTLF